MGYMALFRLGFGLVTLGSRGGGGYKMETYMKKCPKKCPKKVANKCGIHCCLSCAAGSKTDRWFTGILACIGLYCLGFDFSDQSLITVGWGYKLGNSYRKSAHRVPPKKWQKSAEYTTVYGVQGVSLTYQ